ncbi:MAG: hypothetical protein HUK01_06380 [Bacteroidaceae bacterium]|nr:hypothetical protein [Bacteroidaceae bacterium]
MRALGCLSILIFGIVLLIYSALRNIYDAAFGKPNRSRKADSDSSSNRRQQSSSAKSSSPVFPDGEGEYVDYEEVK